jgi:hypothetical protein
LAGGDGPIFFEEAFFFGGRDEVEAVALVETDGPVGVGPGADEDGSGGSSRAGDKRVWRMCAAPTALGNLWGRLEPSPYGLGY